MIEKKKKMVKKIVREVQDEGEIILKEKRKKARFTLARYRIVTSMP